MQGEARKGKGDRQTIRNAPGTKVGQDRNDACSENEPDR
jgi:hypothetical protein